MSTFEFVGFMALGFRVCCGFGGFPCGCRACCGVHEGFRKLSGFGPGCLLGIRGIEDLGFTLVLAARLYKGIPGCTSDSQEFGFATSLAVTRPLGVLLGCNQLECSLLVSVQLKISNKGLKE